MAMLAEPRRRKRTLNLRGKNEWSDDQNKFGQKMLEKMGWAPGKGLGLNLDGSIDHVKVRFKDDNGGVGFKDRNDQWTEHEDNFNGLLKSLHGGAIDTTKLHSDVSLEEKSKKSQSRVHYKKFTRGKDITRYSAKDLANIFGKKTLDPKGNMKESEIECKNKSINENPEEKTSEYNLIAAGSMKDYFKSKLGNKLDKKPLRNLGCKDIIDEPVTNYEKDSDIVFRGFSGTQTHDDDSLISDSKNTDSFSFYPNKPHFDLNGSKESKPFSFYPLKDTTVVKTNADAEDDSKSVIDLSNNVNDKIIKCGKSKKGNKKNSDADAKYSENGDNKSYLNGNENQVSKKSKTKLKNNTCDVNQSGNQSVENNVGVDDAEETTIVTMKDKSKKKKQKLKSTEQIDDHSCNVGEEMLVVDSPNHKVKKNCKATPDNIVNHVDVLNDSSRCKSLKRKKSSNLSCDDELNENVPNPNEGSIKSKKRKKNVEFSLEDNKTYILDQESGVQKPRKKKKNVLGCL